MSFHYAYDLLCTLFALHERLNHVIASLHTIKIVAMRRSKAVFNLCSYYTAEANPNVFKTMIFRYENFA